jgi:hypothetical protein
MYIENGKIQMPTVYVPSWIDAGAKATIGLAGELSWALVDKNGARPKVVRQGRQKNMIVKTGFDKCRGLPRLGGIGEIKNYYNYDYIHLVVGKGTVEPAYSDTVLVDQVGSSSISRKTPASIWSGPVRPAFMATETLTIDENTANDDLTEWGVQFLPYGEQSMTLWCRDLFRDENGVPIVVTKQAGFMLQAQYRLYWDAPIESSVINLNIGGSNYECSTMVANKYVYFYGWPHEGKNNNVFYTYNLSGDYGYVGTSNEANALNDSASLKGSQLIIKQYTVAQAYDSATGKAMLDLTLLGNEGNGAIGEILLGHGTLSQNSALCRTTFTPVLIKTSTQKLVFHYEVSSVANAYDIVRIPVIKDEIATSVAISSLIMTT